MAAAAQLTKATALKKNTVDYIPSKLAYDTAIPVTILEDRSDFIEKCKPYDIIDGPNPLDEPEATDATRPQAQSALVSPPPEVKTVERSSGRANRKSHQSTLKAEKPHPVKRERDTEEGRDGAVVVFTRPSRHGWAAERLAQHRPYQLVRSHDMETCVRYVLDDVDYDWCERQNVAPESLQRGVTYLEWAYASSLLRAATPRVATPEDSGTAAADSVVPGYGEGRHSLSTQSSSPTGAAAAGSGRHTTSGRQNGKDKASAGDAAVRLCALCSKPVQLLTSQSRSGALERGTGGVNTLQKRGGGATHLAGALSSSPTARGGAWVGGGHARGTSAPQPSGLVLPTKRAFGDVSAGIASPSHDLQSRGLRCSDCGVVAHLRCWFFSEPPKLPEAWICDGCTIYAHHRKRSAGMCCICGRAGGVLLPYVPSALRDDSDAVKPGSMQTPAFHGRSSSAAALFDTVCHAVCALSMPELAVHPQVTVLRRNGLVDMQMRPYVYPLRRVGKHKCAMNCRFCQHLGGRCVQCSHPHCFEAMHASCAAEAHTVDCQAELPILPATASPRRTSAGARGGASTLDATTQPISLGCSLSSSLMGTTNWTRCSPYCRKHYGYSVGNSVGSAELGHKAEAEALALDLTGLLTGGDGVTSPVVRKRGRGRPPAALVKQREAERDLILKLRAYWLERREQRRETSALLASEINARVRPIGEASMRPEIVKISAEKVRLSHFLSLVPEWQWQLVSIVEGELPLPDEEYDDVQKFRKAAHTRRSGNTRSLYDKMCESAVQLGLLCRAAEAIKEQCRLRRASVEQELAALRILSGWR
ncbi:PHD-like zinc-binding domain containing protein [Leishmania donovani]|uniref:PHD-like_zinc-binding_domain_containing_protein_p utative/Pfam:PF13771 n=1 Tax=Leishmania donovani TaxID=5661 RepID=A0A6J8FSK9_LEIDO|nr:PHD-like zinc-binding domain containing protein [Leishmania donovani]VDZ49676.1 PHD-like_zinc-binding_domain_containing_protein_putative/Pfam:PF13771 [Leishmania donovani]